VSLVHGVLHRLRALVRREEYERELDEEVRFHLSVDEMHASHGGMPDHEASTAARRTFGSVTRVKEAHRRAAGVAFLDVLRQDLAFATRSWGSRAGRGPAIVTVLTLAVGIGAMTAIYTIVQATLIRPLPVRDPERLVSIQLVEPAERGRVVYGSVGTMELVRAWRDATVLEEIAAFSLDRATLTGLGQTRAVRAYPVTTNMFEFLGVRPRWGRGFLPSEGTPGARPVVVVNSTFATNHFVSDSAAVGRLVTLDGTSREIVGVMPATFHVPGSIGWVDEQGEMWTPMPEYADRARSIRTPADILARLAPGVTESVARVRLDTILAATVGPADLGLFGKVTHIISPHRQLVDGVRTPLLLLAAGSALLVLIACANVANLTLARAVVRRREIAVRAALGAGRSRLVRQLLTESMTLSLVGGGLGVLAAYATLPVILQLAGTYLFPPVGAIGIDRGVLVLALTVTTIVGILVGAAPVTEAGKAIHQPALKEGAANTTMSRWSRLTSDGLVVTQVGLALVLLAAMGLVARSFIGVMTLDRGYETESVLVSRIVIPEQRYATPGDRAALTRAVLDRLEGLSGVTSAAAADAGPILRSRTSRFTTNGAHPSLESPASELWTVSASYFETMGIPLRRGRVATSSAEVVIDETAVRTFFADRDPLGQRLTWGNARRPSPATSGQGVVVGIVGDIREFVTATSTRPSMSPHVFRFLSGEPANLFMTRVASGDPERLDAEVRRVFAGIDADLIVELNQSGSGMVRTWFHQQRFLTQLMLALAGIAFFLATIGIYSVVSYAAARRTREMGIRIALGARRLDIISNIMRQAMRPLLIGVVVGLAATVASARVLRSQLVDVSPTDPIVLAGVTAMLGIAALVASYLPSRRATRIEPTAVLREE
jgi:putative ABC transport system permease protein